MKKVTCNRRGDTITVIIRDNYFNKIYENEYRTKNLNDMENLLSDLRNKGVDLIAIIKNKMLLGTESEWFS